jgi:hypothetical protein
LYPSGTDGYQERYKVTKTVKNKTLTKTWEDPIVEEIRAVREAHAKKFNYDLDAIFNDFKEYEKKVKEQRVERSKKKPA